MTNLIWVRFFLLSNQFTLDDNNIDEMRQCAAMNKKLMKLDERKRNFPSIITVDDALMNIKENDQ